MNARTASFDDPEAHTRHSWGQKMRFTYKTEQECRRCGMVKVTHHQTFENIWVEYWRKGEAKVEGKLTPICTGVKT